MTNFSSKHLSDHHRKTLADIERHPTSENIEWDAVIALLEEAGEVSEERNGKYRVKLGDRMLVLTRPHGKDIDVQLVVDLRELFAAAGYTAQANK